MDAPQRQQWINALLPAMDSAEAEACYRIYSLWLKDKNTEPADIQIQEIISRLLAHEPIQYILNEAWFYGMAFRVNGSTLIPRPETEELCELIIKNTADINLNLLDVGTGSGCIPIALLKYKTGWKATALDINNEALRIAEINAHIHGVEDRIIFTEGDFLDNYSTSETWDLIVSNPPYIDAMKYAGMQKNVLDWEPHTALFTPGNDPLIFYKKLAGLFYKQPFKCSLWAEINPVYAKETLQIFNAFSNKELIKDMSGKWRFLHAVK